jgi:hypothetical protein
MSTTLSGFDQNFNLGEDGSNVTLQDVNGNVYNLGQVTGFHDTPEHEEVSVKTLNGGGRKFTRVERTGGSLEFTVARKDGTLEQIEYQLQQNKRQNLGELYFSVYQYITNPDGSRSENNWPVCVFMLTDKGEWAVGKSVDQKVKMTYVDANVIA